jgi:hypothetical protein
MFMTLHRETPIQALTRVHPLRKYRTTGFVLFAGPLNQCLSRRVAGTKNPEFGVNNLAEKIAAETKCHIGLKRERKWSISGLKIDPVK